MSKEDEESNTPESLDGGIGNPFVEDGAEEGSDEEADERPDVMDFLGSDADNDDEDNNEDDKEDDNGADDFDANVDDAGKPISKLEYILNYKKRPTENSEDQLPPKKRFLLSQAKLERNKYTVGTSKGESLLYNETPDKDDEEKENEPEEKSSQITDKHFRAYRKARLIHKRLKDLESKQELVKLLPPKEFRFKMFLEERLNKIIAHHFNDFDDVQMATLKRQYTSYYIKHQQFIKVQHFLTGYKSAIAKVETKKFQIIPFSPGCTPWNLGRKYLTMNKVGVVWIETKTSTPIVTFQTFDKSIRDNFWFSVDNIYDLCYLDGQGMALAQSGYYDDGENRMDTSGLSKLRRFVRLLYKSHRDNLEFTTKIELLKNEFVSTISIANRIIYVFINTGMVKMYSSGSGFLLGMRKSFPTVASLGSDNFLFNIEIQDPYAYEFLYSIEDVVNDRYLMLHDRLNIETVRNPMVNTFNDNIVTFDILRGIFFNDNGFPSYVDANEYLYVYDGDTGFVPMLNLLDAFNNFNPTHNSLIYFPLSVTGGNVQAVVIKDAIIDQKMGIIQGKISRAQRQVVSIEKEIKQKQRTQNILDKRMRKKTEESEEATEQEKPTKPLSKAEIAQQTALEKNRKIVENSAGYIMKSSNKSDYFSVESYNFPWFPLPGLNNFKLRVPVDTCQELTRNTAFNDPKLLEQAENEKKKDDEEVGDSLFDDEETENARINKLFGIGDDDDDAFEDPNSKFNKLISGNDLDSASINALFFMKSLSSDVEEKNLSKDDQEERRDQLLKFALQHDSNLLRLFNELLQANKMRLAFNLVKLLKLNKSFEAVKKICILNNKKLEGQGLMKFKKVIDYWQSKKKKNYDKWYGQC
ncbi:hypothetical protein DASC09_025520 [Saccharomycopsis crataegensis]|uniref:WDHD1/CFT4 second beta-propeller domain-containing protein n=1 Tax=Saccharomycopsis crataegensis TaxID=43959 RepID=A0AAV5QL02_9ASCO|nr:hypothetical protein DASC09_025520 [Saccharomycopsis crataegensis]